MLEANRKAIWMVLNNLLKPRNKDFFLSFLNNELNNNDASIIAYLTNFCREKKEDFKGKIGELELRLKDIEELEEIIEKIK